MHPSISVLIPTFNVESTLRAALSSVSRQTCQDWECIVSDDGSNDRTCRIAAAHARADRRFRLVRASHAGIVPALNRGLHHCRGRFVARFDADDLMHRDRLCEQLAAVSKSPDLAGVGTLVRIFPRRCLTKGRETYERWLNALTDEESVYRDRFVECPLAHPTLLLRRDLLTEFEYRDSGWPEDYDLVLRLLGAGHRLSTVPRVLHYWREGRQRLSRVGPQYQIGCFTRCKAHFLARDWLGPDERYVLWGYGSTGRHLARALADLGKHPSAILELHPGRVGQRIFSAPVLAVPDLVGLGQPRDRIIVSVAGEGPRMEARRRAASLGLREGRDFVCAA